MRAKFKNLSRTSNIFEFLTFVNISIFRFLKFFIICIIFLKSPTNDRTKNPIWKYPVQKLRSEKYQNQFLLSGAIITSTCRSYKYIFSGNNCCTPGKNSRLWFWVLGNPRTVSRESKEDPFNIRLIFRFSYSWRFAFVQVQTINISSK